jgi:hypothetical protein
VARYKIVRAKDGSEPKKFKPGEANTNIEADISSRVEIRGHERIVWETAAGLKPLHQTSKARNIPSGSIGYIHDPKDNTLFAVSRLDKTKHTLEITAQGKVNGGVHTF